MDGAFGKRGIVPIALIHRGSYMSATADVARSDGLRRPAPSFPSIPSKQTQAASDVRVGLTPRFRGPNKGNKNMPIGKVKFFNEQKGYGFIEPEDGGGDAFVHMTAVQAAGMSTLKENQRVSYELEESRNGKMAATNLEEA